MRRVVFSSHAKLKLRVLARHGWQLTISQVEAAIRGPNRVDQGYGGRKVAQTKLDEEHVLRVIYEERGEDLIVVTLYPGRRERYEKG